MRRNPALAAALLAAFAVSGCQCNVDDDFISDPPDAGPPIVDAGPPPPVFPLKAGDILEMPAYGGRTATCAGGDGSNGGCDRNISASYGITDVKLNAANRWEVTADVVYSGLVDTIPSTALSRLALENTAPFDVITTQSPQSAEAVAFATDVPPSLDPTKFGTTNFPFFQGENGSNDGDDGTVFNEGADLFRAEILAVDAEANVSTQLAAGKLEAFFRDPIGEPISLHKLLVQVHPMGFFCGWDESLIDFADGMARGQSAFSGVDNPPLTATFNSPTLTRDGVKYQCSCLSGTCRKGTECLDPTNPDAPPGPCP